MLSGLEPEARCPPENGARPRSAVSPSPERSYSLGAFTWSQPQNQRGIRPGTKAKSPVRALRKPSLPVAHTKKSKALIDQGAVAQVDESCAIEDFQDDAKAAKIVAGGLLAQLL